MSDIDFSSLFGADDSAANNQLTALAQAIAKRRQLSEAASFLGGPYAEMGKEFGGTAHDLQQAAQQAAQFRGLHGPAMREDAQARDPQSPMSQLGPQLAKQLGMEIPQGTPFSAYSSMLPEATKAVTANSLASHRGILEGQADRRISATEEALALKGIRYNPNTGQFENVKPGARGPRIGGAPPVAAPIDGADGPPNVPSNAPVHPGFPPLGGKILDKALKDLKADFDPSGGKAGNFGKQQAVVNAANKIFQLARDPDGNPKDLTPNQMPELSQAVAALISNGGQGSQAQIEHLTPQTLRGNLQGTLQWLTGDPRGADQVAFVKNMLETAERERGVAQQSIETTRHQRGAAHQRVLLGNPEEARRVLQGFDWDIGPDGLPVLAPKGGGGTKALPAGAKIQKSNKTGAMRLVYPDGRTEPYSP